MQLFPAIDLRDGRAVRLLRGEFGAETVYSEDPVAVAGAYEAAGARWVHVVDLDAARTGEPANIALVAAIASAVSCPVQAGGGVRTPEAAARLLDVGVARVVVGTAAVEEPALVEALCRRYPGQVAAGLDARGSQLAVRGWTETAAADLTDAARRLEDTGVAALVVTEIGRDGTMAGPDLDQLGAVLSATAVDVVASGGVGSLADLRSLSTLEPAPGRRLAGVIVGRAFYEGRFSVQEALACLAPV
ncbi:MAG TPA: 1-(5-phosphoribosyl)-5-[(5-phosphoribosylamino)methylideneamino]imidazole-4-carboxamide isomerase [Acidimicrobiia bacterium]